MKDMPIPYPVLRNGVSILIVMEVENEDNQLHPRFYSLNRFNPYCYGSRK